MDMVRSFESDMIFPHKTLAFFLWISSTGAFPLKMMFAPGGASDAVRFARSDVLRLCRKVMGCVPRPPTPAGTSRPQDTSRAKRSSCSAHAEHIVEKSRCALRNGIFLERATRFELATSTLARWRSAK